MSEQLFENRFKKVDLTKKFGGVRLPSLTLDSGMKSQVGLPESANNVDVLNRLVETGLADKLKRGVIKAERLKDYRARLVEELEIVNKLHFTDYFLILWDFINYCRSEKIPVGKGRGSAAGSLVLYLLGVTGLDPIRYGLLFERFISPSRSKSKEIDGEIYLTGTLPDVDVDLCYINRHKVVEYLDKKYPNRTAKILNFTTLTGKNLIKECGKIVYGKSEGEMHTVSEMVQSIFGKVQDIEDVYRENPKFKAWCDANPIAYDVALHLRNLIKNKSVHASGLVISKDEITETSPVELTSDGKLVCSFNMNDIAEFLVKFDLLGLKTLSMANEVCILAGEKFEDIPFESPEIYGYLRTNDYFYGLFQLEAATAFGACKLVQPESIHHTAHIMALGRPGAMAFIREYKEYKEKGIAKKIHPLIDDILEPTYGFLIFQEQIMKIINRLGFSLEEGYAVVKIIGKKQRDKVGEWEQKIRDAGKIKGLPESVIKLIWETLKASADYSFNASHAYCYGALAAITAYLKLHYPIEFFLAALRIAQFEQKPFECIARIVTEMPNFGIKFIPPDFTAANENFEICGNGIRFGLAAIKGISEKKLEKLRKFNINNSNKFEMFVSANEAKVDIATLTGLIQAGALSGFSENRTRLVLEAQLWNLLTPREKEFCLANGDKYNHDLIKMVKHINEWTGDNGKAISRATRLDTIRNKYAPYKKIYEQNIQYEDLANWYYEKTLLGFPYSTTLKQIFSKSSHSLVGVDELDTINDRSVATCIGVVMEANHGKTKKGAPMSKFLISDERGQKLVFLFDPTRAKLMKDKNLPKENDICAFKITRSGDLFMIQDWSTQSNKIYMKLADARS